MKEDLSREIEQLIEEEGRKKKGRAADGWLEPRGASLKTDWRGPQAGGREKGPVIKTRGGKEPAGTNSARVVVGMLVQVGIWVVLLGIPLAGAWLLWSGNEDRHVTEYQISLNDAVSTVQAQYTAGTVVAVAVCVLFPLVDMLILRLGLKKLLGKSAARGVRIVNGVFCIALGLLTLQAYSVVAGSHWKQVSASTRDTVINATITPTKFGNFIGTDDDMQSFNYTYRYPGADWDDTGYFMTDDTETDQGTLEYATGSLKDGAGISSEATATAVIQEAETTRVYRRDTLNSWNPVANMCRQQFSMEYENNRAVVTIRHK